MRTFRITAGSMLLAAWLGAPALAQSSADVPPCTDSGLSPATPSNNHVMTSEDYPILSRNLHEQGNTLLKIVVNADGTVGDPQVVTSSGTPRLDEAAIDIVHNRWRYNPARDAAGKPVACSLKVVVAWKLTPNIFDFFKFNPITIVQVPDADYPPDALARGEKGVAIVAALVGADGKPKVQLVHSSGLADLDQAAAKLASAKLHVSEATYDGKPATTCVFLVLVFGPMPPMPPMPPKPD